ncbi:kelch-like protein 8 isoform X2 [Ptychodera flava]|uniref:kelch-like protein 8 isoform X2 n=1 Tax=Ptychodera flava TaxID=63121 RepID=UPI00396A1D76
MFKGNRLRVGTAHIMGDTLFEEPNPSSVFEAKSLCKDSFVVLNELFEAGKLCDVLLKVGKKQIKCHRIILASASSYFRAMLTSEMTESRQDIITIKDIDENAMTALVRFMYSSKITLTTDNVQPLLYASSILQMEIVARACCEFMKTHLHPSNCLGVRNFAELHGRTDLVKAADSYTFDHFLEVIQNDEFYNISGRHFGLILTSSNLNIESEQQVYEAMMKWVKYDVVMRQQHLPDLMSKIRLPMLPPSYLMDIVEREELVKKHHSCRDLVDEAKNYHLSSARIVSHPSPRQRYSLRSKPRKSTAGVLFTIGGRGASGDPFRSIECYDLRQNRWFQVTEMTTRRRHVGVTSVNGKVFAVGGHDGKEHLNSLEMFNPKTNIWIILAPMRTYRRGIAVTSLNGPIYAIGGLDDNSCFIEVERYDITSDSWSFVAPMTCPRGGVGVAPLQNHIYAGGFDDNAPLDTVEVYDPQTDDWSSLDRMASARGGVGVTALGGKLYAVGGHDGSSYLNSVECYDPVANRWESVCPIDVCRAGAGVVTCMCSVSDLKDIGLINVVSCV